MKRAALAAVAAAALVAGCGGGGGGHATVWVTRDEGRTLLVDARVPAGESALQALVRVARVGTRYGGRFVQSVNGLDGSIAKRRDWFYFVNGIEGSKGSAAVRVHDGDQVWWDRHDWAAAMDVPAVVGSYPEPFLHGIGGKRLPVRVECSPPNAPGCKEASDLLGKAGVIAARGGLAASFTKQTLRILIGLWPAIRDDDAARQIEQGPGVSGVFARMAPNGRSLALLDANGHTVRTLGADAGLVAATSFQHGKPVWVVTGTDVRGLTDAAQALQAGILKNRFALVTDHGTPLSAPER